MKAGVNLTAHSGCDGTLRDSIESVYAGIQNGADAVEVDVRQNSGGELILSHDKDPGGTYQGSVTLKDVFALVTGTPGLGINCDVKEREAVPGILSLASTFGLGPDRLVLTGSSTPSMVRENRKILEKAWVWLNIEEIVADYYRNEAAAFAPCRQLFSNGDADQPGFGHRALRALGKQAGDLVNPICADCLSLGVQIVNMPFAGELIPLISRFMAAGISVSVWTLNDCDSVQRAAELGVFNITTLDTRQARKVLNCGAGSIQEEL